MQNDSYETLRRYVWPLHGQRDAVEGNEEQNNVIEPLR